MNYLYGGDGLFAIYVQNNGADTMYYVQKNYLGSYYCITDASGNIATLNGQKQVYSFGPWGRRRNATTWTYDNVPQNFLFDRGFTGQEHLDVFGLINLNGRSYDPWLGRFLSVDPIVDDLSNTQRFNSYTYANNNPMRFVDPTGYDGFDDVYTGPGMQTWVKPEQDGNNAFFGSGGGGGGGGNGFHYSYTDHAYEDANGNIVGWNYINASYVGPNAISIFNSNSVNGIISMSINIFDNSVEIKMEYLESWSSVTNSAGQHVGFDDISIGNGFGTGGGNVAGSTGNGSNFIETINNTSNIASKATEAISLSLSSTRFGSNIAYILSNNAVLSTGIEFLKPFGYWLAGLSVVSDGYLSATGQQPWGETITNTAVTGIAFEVGGWPGLFIQLDYMGAKAYLKTSKEHPEWVLPSWYFSR